MASNCANTILNMKKGCQEILLQCKDFCNSRKKSKVVAINKANKLVFPKKYISLKTRSSGKVHYSKSSCFRLFSENQLIKYFVSLVSLTAMIKTEE